MYSDDVGDAPTPAGDGLRGPQHEKGNLNMRTFTTVAFVPKTDEEIRRVTLNINLGKDLNEAAKLFGADVVHAVFQQAAIVKVQGSLVRPTLAITDKKDEDYMTDAQLQAAVDDWKMTIGRTSDPDAVDAAAAKRLAKMTPERVAKILAAAKALQSAPAAKSTPAATKKAPAKSAAKRTAKRA